MRSGQDSEANQLRHWTYSFEHIKTSGTLVVIQTKPTIARYRILVLPVHFLAMISNTITKLFNCLLPSIRISDGTFADHWDGQPLGLQLRKCTVMLLSILNVLLRISVNSIECPNLIHNHWDTLRARPIFLYTDHLCQSLSSKFCLLEAGHKSIKMSRHLPTLTTSFKLSRISTISFFLISSYHSSLL